MINLIKYMYLRQICSLINKHISERSRAESTECKFLPSTIKQLHIRL